MQRRLYLAAGMAVMLFLGLVEGWTIFILPFKALFPSWNFTKLSVVLTLVEADFALGGIIAARILKRAKPRVVITLVAFMECLSWLCLSRLDTGAPGESLIILYILYGGVLGIANGMGYNVFVVIISGMFQEKQGTASGALVMMYGLGQLVIGTAATELIGVIGLFRTLALLGIAVGAVCAASAAVMRNAVTAASGEAVNPNFTGAEIGPLETIKRSDFWLFFLWQTVINSAGFLALNSASPMAAAFGAPAAFGLIISAGNTGGRFLSGVIYDKAGRTAALGNSTVLIAISAALFILGNKTGSAALILAGLLAAGLFYGGNPSLGAAYVNAEYGHKYFSANLSLITCTTIPAAFIGPIISSRLIDSAGGDYGPAFKMVAVLAIMAALLMAALESARGRERRSE